MIDLNKTLNAIAQSKATKARVEPKLKSVTPEVAFRFWDRFLENSQSILLLVQSGYTNEAIAIQRLSIENFAYAVALLQGKLTEQKLKDQMDAELPAQAEKMRRSDERHPTLTPENREKLENFLNDAAARSVTDPGINTYNALGSCGLDFFHTRYRHLSIRAAHATLLSAKSTGTPAEVEELFLGMQDLLKLLDAIAMDAVAHMDDKVD
jgi:hypothetical protein